MLPAQENNNRRQTADEIDLRELFLTLWASKILIIAITLLVACAAAAYAFLSTPIYEVQVQTLPPTQGRLAAYNMANQLSGAASQTLSQRPEQMRRPDQKPEADNAILVLSPDDAYKV